MKKDRLKFVPVMILLAVFALLSVSPAFAGDKEGKEVTLSGWITDEWCGKANANAKGKDCSVKCAKDGAKLVLFSDEKMYVIDNQELAMKNVGFEVVVKGTVGKENALVVTSIKKKDAA
jgi:hypothetical protein